MTQEELTALNPDAKSKVFGAGVRARVTNLRWMDKIRTWQELLFVVRDMGTCPMEPFKAAEVITGSGALMIT